MGNSVNAGIKFLLQQKISAIVAAIAATKTIQSLIFTADTAGSAGNDIIINYTGGATAGSEVVTVFDSIINVQIQTGVSTATQVKAAIDGSGSAAALVNVAIVSGQGSTAQVVTTAPIHLSGGVDTQSEDWITIGGLRSKSMSFNSEVIDITNHGSQEFRELIEGHGTNSMDVSGSGVFVSDDALEQAKLDVISKVFRDYRLIHDETGEIYSGSFRLATLELAGEHNAEMTWSMSLQSSGVVTYTPAA